MNIVITFFAKSLKRKILLNSLLVLCLLSASIYFLTSRFAMEHFYRMAEEHMSYRLESQAQLLEESLAQKVTMLESFAGQTEWNIELTAGGVLMADWTDRYQMRSALTFFQESQGGSFRSAFLITPDLQMMHTLSPGMTQVTSLQWERVMERDEAVISTAVQSASTGELISVIAVPLEIYGVRAAIVGVTIPLETFARMEITDRNGFNGAVYVVDEEGRYLVHPDKSQLHQTTEMDLTQQGEGKYFRYRGGNGERDVVFVSSLRGTPGWKMVGSVPEAIIFQEIHQMRRLIIYLINVGLLVFMGLIYFLTKRFTQPLVNMQRVFDRAASGDLFVKADVRSRDELGQAARSFNKMIERLRKITYFDALTDLPNMKYFLYNMESKTQGRAGDHFAVVLVSINDFKKINETYGFNVGDAILVELARRLKKHIQVSDPMDYVARFGGDEFIVFLSQIREQEDLEHEMIQIMQLGNKPFYVDAHQLSVRYTLGGLFFEGDARMDHDQLVATVSLARSQAKLSKVPYKILMGNDNDDSQIRRNKMIENDLYKAIESEELEVYYHPILDLLGNKVSSLEALLRWKHPTEGYIPPDVFIPIAEESGQMGTIGRWVLENACAQMKQWQEEFPKLAISVNVSPEQFTQKDFLQILLDTLCAIDFDPHRLHLEITEEVGLFNLKEQDEKLSFLNDWGVKISVDDFGTGYASFRYLAQMNIDQLKIDRSFVRDMLQSEKSKAIVKTIVSMAHALKMDCVAEGVETTEQMEYLRELGCGKIQGYLLTIPLPAPQMYQWLKNHSTGTI